MTRKQGPPFNTHQEGASDQSQGTSLAKPHLSLHVQSCAETKGNKFHNVSPPERSDGTLWVSSLHHISAILCWRLGNSLDFFGVLPDIIQLWISELIF